MPRVWERGQRVLELRPVLDKVTIRRPWSFVVPENTKKKLMVGFIYLFFLKKKDSGANRVQHFWLACRAGMPGGRQVVVVPHTSRHTGPLRSTGADGDGRTRVPRGVVDARVWWMRADVSCCTPADAHHVREWKEGRKNDRVCQ